LFGTQVASWIRLAIAAGGLLSIYLGYKLFCDVPVRIGRTFRRVVILNLVSGVALALLGVGILTADIRSMQNNDSPALRHKKSAEEGSFTGPGVDHSRAEAVQAA
jgi:hypothetical protein